MGHRNGVHSRLHVEVEEVLILLSQRWQRIRRETEEADTVCNFMEINHNFCLTLVLFSFPKKYLHGTSSSTVYLVSGAYHRGPCVIKEMNSSLGNIRTIWPDLGAQICFLSTSSSTSSSLSPDVGLEAFISSK